MVFGIMTMYLVVLLVFKWDSTNTVKLLVNAG